MTTENPIDYSNAAAALQALVRSTRLLMAALDIAEMGPSLESDRSVLDARRAVEVVLDGIWNARVAKTVMPTRPLGVRP
jgi:hypothetical protein